MLITIFSINIVSAADSNSTCCISHTLPENKDILSDADFDLENEIINANEGDEILINPGTYKLHNVTVTKNLTLQGKGNPDDVIIDGENKSSIFLIRNASVHVTFKNLTFINGLTENFGGAISMETGNVYVDNCNFINNTALNNTNAGGISNYGTADKRAYLLVNNSLFLNNHADHDGGAITTCYASSYIYNSVFIGNSAHRDGGAIRVSVYGYGTVEDCIFMYNHADEWGGAYYSWASNSNINRCIFMNNTGGTNGGAVMVSGNITLTNSIIVNNTSNETGGSFYIQQPMFDAKTIIDVHDNLITNNTSPLGKEIYIKWKQTKLLFTKFNDNDWGNEDPTDSDVIDPDHVTPRSKVTSTKKSNLLDELTLDLLNKYSSSIKDYFPKNYFGDDEKEEYEENMNNNTQKDSKDNPTIPNQQSNSSQSPLMINKTLPIDINNFQNANSNSTMPNTDSNADVNVNGSSEVGVDSKNTGKASEIFKHSPSKYISSFSIGAILFLIIAIIALIIGYKKHKNQFK